MKHVVVHNRHGLKSKTFWRIRGRLLRRAAMPLRILAPLAMVAAALLAPAGARPADSSCVHTDAVFYSTDTLALVPRLHAAQSACADYYVSVTPKTDGSGSPRGGVTPIFRANGPQFHAMTEVRLVPWGNWVKNPANCDVPDKTCWYKAGVEIRKEMVTAGFDVSKGDTWAINEVGSPTPAIEGDMPKHVFANDDGGVARANLVEFIRGLYTGTGLPDMPPAPGLVFAANPTQITTNLEEYKQGLRRWYQDGAFWSDIKPYVRFWAQETYADARNWGVADKTLPDRATHLNDYFQHAARLVAVDPDASEAARTFLAATYTPIANAAYPWGPPENTPEKIGFGFTNITVPQMQNFIATQTYALRSSPAATRFGFAWVPLSNSDTRLPTLRDTLAQSIQRSETDPAGACGAALALCDSFLDSAAFTEAWKTFTDATPPVVDSKVTGQKGENGWYVGDVTVSWNVSDPESAVTTSGCETTVVDTDTAGATFTCSATSQGGTTTGSVTIKRDATPPALSVPDDFAVDATSADGATVTYAVSANDALTGRLEVSCAPPSGSVFPLGTTTVSCTARDDAGNAASKSFHVRVRGAAEQIARLEDAVTAATLRQGLRTALLAKLDAAAQALAKGDDACPHFDAFVNLVRNAERVGHLEAGAAESFAVAAVQAARVTGCSPAA